MKRQKITLVPTDVEKIEGIVNGVLQKQEDKKKKEAHINKVLKKDEMLDKKKKEIHIDKILEKDEPLEKKHVHSCPSCQAALEKKQEGFEICKDCGTVDITLKKGEKVAICNACGGIIPESLVGGENKGCPHCGSEAGARWA